VGLSAVAEVGYAGLIALDAAQLDAFHVED
jgi:hypothetical protein